jgi:hypothetical protein
MVPAPAHREGREAVAFDWFKDFASLEPCLSSLLPDRDARILHLGCGNSRLGEDM